MSDTHGVEHPAGTLELPDRTAVMAELDRILASDAFAAAGRLSRLLRFVVERTLDGRGDEIKEYVLGTEVFDRGVDYDPRIDSIVRVEARRLRTKLEEYYAGPGAASDVAIHLHRGGYVPVFELRRAASTLDVPAITPAPSIVGRRDAARRPAVWMAIAVVIVAVAVTGMLVVRSPTPVEAGVLPRVAVLPFTHYPPDAESAALADRIADGITTELVRLGRLEIVSRMSTREFAAAPRPVAVVGQALGAAWLVEARVLREGDAVRIETRLVDATRDRKVWADDFEGGADDVRALERRAAAAIDAAVRSAIGPRRP